MARPPRPPSPSLRTPIKRELGADEAATHTPAAAAHTPLPPRPLRKHRPKTPTQPHTTPQSIPSNTLPPSRPTSPSIKREPDSDEVATHPAPTTAFPAADEDDGEKPPPPARLQRPGPTRIPLAKTSGPGPTLAVNRRRLGRLLHELSRAHRWSDAAGVASALLAGTPRPASFHDARSTFVVAMEIQKRLTKSGDKQLQNSKSPYYLRAMKLFDVWMNRLKWLKKCPRKQLVKLELALFHLSQGNIKDAYNTTRAIVAKQECEKEPTLNLIHGLISYELWYSGLPKDMQIREFDIYKQSCTTSMTSNGYEETALLESLDDHNSIDTDNASFSACASESSVCNEKSVLMDCKRKIPRKKSNFAHPVQESYSSGSEMNEDIDASNLQSVFFSSADTLACGLETSLLPVQLKHLVGTSNGSFDSYRKYISTPNALYEDAEKYLRTALHSTPQLMAALLPLIQLLLLGDKLGDALDELEKSCHSSTIALPFRLRGRLLEYFYQNQVSTISCCYEEALRRDPTCSYSMERLIKMHRNGCYNTIQLYETIALHLDSINGKPRIWEELVSCFLRLFADQTSDYEDRISCNVQGDLTFTTFGKISSVFMGRHTRESWKVRCRWWMNHHFSEKVYNSEAQIGDCKLLASKAACASHLFGPEFLYVKAVESFLWKQGAIDEIRFLTRNRQNSVRLLQTLEGLAS